MESLRELFKPHLGLSSVAGSAEVHKEGQFAQFPPRCVDVRYFVRLKKNAFIDSHRASCLCESGIKNSRDPHQALISHAFDGEETLAIYRKRWGIETLFGHLK